jgi:serine/threonine-protein kinase
MSDQTDDLSTEDVGGGPLDAGLRAAFGLDAGASGWGGESVLALLERERGAGVGSHVLLRDGPESPSEVIRPATPGGGAGLGRYQVAGEIARGGVGVVLKGRDVDIGREVAIKTLREEYAGQPAMVRRLVEEAQIGGQLQHPGVLPVYEMGLDPSRRPYFTMKLVRGQTLAALLHDRADPARERRRFLAAFEQVCQTVAYAHARGVIHRDLKPSNVMVGGFGEVQVVDWGLAKVLDRGGVADERPSPTPGEATVATVRSERPGSHSEAGSVLGTPAYMPPEQARGEVDGLDERSDVFALGAVLCEILTGLPPYHGPRAEVLRQAAEGQTGDALARLDACGADADLVRLARACLAADPSARPRDASAVAREVSAYLASADERVKQADLAAALARSRAEAERRARWVIVAAAAVVLLAVLGVGGAYVQAERARVSRLQHTLAVIASLETKGNWLIEGSRLVPDSEAWRWADALALTTEAVRQTLALDLDEPGRQLALARLEKLRQAEAALRARAAQPPTSEPASAPAGRRR